MFSGLILGFIGNEFIGNKDAAIGSQGESLFDSKKTGGEKRKRQANFDPSDLEGYTGMITNSCLFVTLQLFALVFLFYLKSYCTVID